MKVCFHHELFDVDVSSGTIHALYQWFELLQAFDVTECAIINKTGDALPTISSDMKVTEYATIEAFIKANRAAKTFVEKGGKDYKSFDFSKTKWLVFGGTSGLPKAHVQIETGTASLYPREAAAIILAGF